jgi:hypothetical protein
MCDMLRCANTTWAMGAGGARALGPGAGGGVAGVWREGGPLGDVASGAGGEALQAMRLAASFGWGSRPSQQLQSGPSLRQRANSRPATGPAGQQPALRRQRGRQAAPARRAAPAAPAAAPHLQLVEERVLLLCVVHLPGGQHQVADARLHVQLLQHAVHVAGGARVFEADEGRRRRPHLRDNCGSLLGVRAQQPRAVHALPLQVGALQWRRAAGCLRARARRRQARGGARRCLGLANGGGPRGEAGAARLGANGAAEADRGGGKAGGAGPVRARPTCRCSRCRLLIPSW